MSSRQNKIQSFYPGGRAFRITPVNHHADEKLSDCEVAVKQMIQSLPNLKWVSIVVAWFGNSLDARRCFVEPKVEHKDRKARYTYPWSVADIGRMSASLMGRSGGVIHYGGTPSDKSVIQLCWLLRKSGIKVLLYPMLFIDRPGKPWRGRITAKSASDIHRWFNNGAGYNRFIMHYAKLCSSIINGIVIGSEMIGLTSFNAGRGHFPAVGEFIKLAGRVKKVLPSYVTVTYAADWSEYHHTQGGWFNMDALWACKDIDVIGIDAYFPLTGDLPQELITKKKIKDGWSSGEGWDYYYKDKARKVKKYFDSPVYAWKNVEYWWTHRHKNPDGRYTDWRPRMKPLWFTEFGFPSVDGASNQPNVFYDPTSTECAFPRGSRGQMNFMAQRHAIDASYKYFSEISAREPGLLAKTFLWTYDARPYPAWPDRLYTWRDGVSWKYGHWINGKIAMTTIRHIIEDILQLVSLPEGSYDCRELDQVVEGVVIKDQISARGIIEKLQEVLFFDISSSGSTLRFYPKFEPRQKTEITSDNIVSEAQELYFQMNRIQDLEIPSKVVVNYIDASRKYDAGSASCSELLRYGIDHITDAPVVMYPSEAQRAASILLALMRSQRIYYELELPAKYSYLQPGDVIALYMGDNYMQMRISSSCLNMGQMRISIKAMSFLDKENTQLIALTSQLKDHTLIEDDSKEENIADTHIEFVDLPSPVEEGSSVYGIYAAAIASSTNWRGAQIYISLDMGHDYSLIAPVNNEACSGICQEILSSGSLFVIDNVSKLKIKMVKGALSSVPLYSLFAGSNTAIVGDEVIQFMDAKLVADDTYEISGLLRGLSGTEDKIGSHKEGERFILFDEAIVSFEIPLRLIGSEVMYKALSAGKVLGECQEQKISLEGRALKPLSPVHVKYEILRCDSRIDLKLWWIRRARSDYSWRNFSDIPLSEEFEKYKIEITQNGQVRELTSSTDEITIEDIKPGSAKIKIAQASAIVGAGFYRQLNIDI